MFEDGFQRQADDVGDAAAHHADMRIVFLLNGVSARMAAPRTGSEVLIQLGIAQRVDGYARLLLPGDE